jgi:DNA-binding NarL/FixJ family response regulator
MMLIGLRQVLARDGIEVVGEASEPTTILSETRRLQPDAVLLNLDGRGSRPLADRVRGEAPSTKVILYARDETLMEVLDPASDTVRLATSVSAELRRDHSSGEPQRVGE